MVKSELIEKLAERSGITLFKAEELVELFFNNMADVLCQGGRVEIRGFGAFSVKEYKSYVGRNPKTGAEVHVPSKKLPVWRTGTELRQRVDSNFSK
ncbi:MAG: integration host factor subunit beta [Oligoflexales bacterium]|nr:integration host factor subunit beta [Oligoflexales bacterium]